MRPAKDSEQHNDVLSHLLDDLSVNDIRQGRMLVNPLDVIEVLTIS